MTTRRRFRRRHGDVDDWLMTYADMITLLLCFFAVFLSVSVPKEDKFEKASETVRQQFGVPQTPEGDNPPHNIPRGLDEEVQVNYGALPSIVGTYDDNRAQKEDRPGDRFVSLEMNSAPFFASGAATLSEEGKKLLADVLAKVKDGQYKDYIVTVEGHTDDNPIATPQFPSNWELSTGRASAVVKYFIEQGVPPARLRASGYADTFPKVPNRDAAGKPIPDNQAQNRRVIIKLEKIDKEEKK